MTGAAWRRRRAPACLRGWRRAARAPPRSPAPPAHRSAASSAWTNPTRCWRLSLRLRPGVHVGIDAQVEVLALDLDGGLLVAAGRGDDERLPARARRGLP